MEGYGEFEEEAGVPLYVCRYNCCKGDMSSACEEAWLKAGDEYHFALERKPGVYAMGCKRQPRWVMERKCGLVLKEGAPFREIDGAEELPSKGGGVFPMFFCFCEGEKSSGCERMSRHFRKACAAQ